MYVHVLLLVSGTDCTQIKTLSPRATSGVYVIQPARVRSPFKVWKHLNIYARYYIIWLHSHTGAVKLSYGMLKVSPGLPELLEFHRVPTNQFVDSKVYLHCIQVYCEMLTDGGWTVFQMRTGAEVLFNKTWAEYEQGFGHLQSKEGSL